MLYFVVLLYYLDFNDYSILLVRIGEIFKVILFYVFMEYCN